MLGVHPLLLHHLPILLLLLLVHATRNTVITDNIHTDSRLYLLWLL